MRGSSLLYLAASFLIAVAGLTTWYLTQRGTGYTTSIGEQRSIALDDGSSVELNARSRIRVRFTDRERSVNLLEGQALFQVAKDRTRPFIVSSGGARVRAVGTRFDINRRKSVTTVTVLEGKVGVNSDPASASSTKTMKAGEVFLVAGEQITVTPAAVALPKRADISAATAWTQHQLVFDSIPLVEVAEEFNRYNKRPIVIHDKALEAFGVIGVFSSTDPTSLLTFLRAQPEIEVIEKVSEIRITRK